MSDAGGTLAAMGVIYWLAMFMAFSSIIFLIGLIVAAIVAVVGSVMLAVGLCVYAVHTLSRVESFHHFADVCVASVFSVIAIVVVLSTPYFQESAEIDFVINEMTYGGLWGSLINAALALLLLYPCLWFLGRSSWFARLPVFVVLPAVMGLIAYSVLVPFKDGKEVGWIFLIQDDLATVNEVVYKVKPIGPSHGFKGKPTADIEYQIYGPGDGTMGNAQLPAALWTATITTEEVIRKGYTFYLRAKPGEGFGPNGYTKIRCTVFVNDQVLSTKTVRVSQKDEVVC